MTVLHHMPVTSLQFLWRHFAVKTVLL